MLLTLYVTYTLLLERRPHLLDRALGPMKASLESRSKLRGM